MLIVLRKANIEKGLYRLVARDVVSNQIVTGLNSCADVFSIQLEEVTISVIKTNVVAFFKYSMSK